MCKLIAEKFDYFLCSSQIIIEFVFPASNLIYICLIIITVFFSFSYGYNAIGTIFYILAAICVLYCQDSIYRLNSIISTVFMFVALHQIITPIIPVIPSKSPEEVEMSNRIEKLKEELNKD